jgi:hypothetical protein
VRKLEAVGSVRGQRARISMLLAGIEIYVANAERLKLLRRIPAIVALVMAAIGTSTLLTIVSTGSLGARIVLYFLAWTLLGTVLSLYVFLGALGSIRGKAADLDNLDPTLPKITISWKYVEPIAAFFLILLVGMSVLQKL